MKVWVVYDPGWERVVGVFSTEAKADAFRIKYNDKHDLWSCGYEAIYGAFAVDDENAGWFGTGS